MRSPQTLLGPLAWSALYLCGVFAFLVEVGCLGTPLAPDLARLPSRVGELEVLEEIAFDPAALGEQPPEGFAFRRVVDARGNEGRLFVAYYERAQRWSGRPHDVEKCYAAQGWIERESHRLDELHRPWSRRFERAEAESEAGVEATRVVHWIERPGPDEDRLAWRELLARVVSGRGFRPDVASVYLEFPADLAPGDAAFVQAVSDVSLALEALW